MNEEGGEEEKKGETVLRGSSRVASFLSTSSSPGSPYTGNRSVKDSFVGAVFPLSPPHPLLPRTGNRVTGL